VRIGPTTRQRFEMAMSLVVLIVQSVAGRHVKCLRAGHFQRGIVTTTTQGWAPSARWSAFNPRHGLGQSAGVVGDGPDLKRLRAGRGQRRLAFSRPDKQLLTKTRQRVNGRSSRPQSGVTKTAELVNILWPPCPVQIKRPLKRLSSGL